MIAAPAYFTQRELLQAVGGEIRHRGAKVEEYLGISTDTRDDLRGRLFVALVGERFDAHDFLEAAQKNGAAGLLVSNSGLERAGGVSRLAGETDIIAVPDTLKSLGDLASYHQQRLGTPVIAITGSNGKTTTKEMLASILSQRFSVLPTLGNLNNLVGLPLTVLRLESHHQWCVAEMGMNARGEIGRMAEITSPVVGLITNIGPAHIGELGSMEGIALAKGELFEQLSLLAGTAVINLDDHRIVERSRASKVKKQLTFGTHANADIHVGEVHAHAQGLNVELCIFGHRNDFELPLHGTHNALNAAAAVGAAIAAAPNAIDVEAIQLGLKAVGEVKGRLAVRSIGSLTVVDDSYNANAASAFAAIQTAAAFADERRLVVAFGAMKELGGFSAEAHAKVGAELANAGAAVVAAFGPEAGPVAEECRAGLARHEAEDFEALASWFISNLRPSDVVLVKGSRGSKMERMIVRIEESI